MKNILYAGPFKDGTGYSQAAVNTAIALSKVANVQCANVKMATQHIEPLKEIYDLESNKLPQYDIVVQNILPPLMQYIAGAKNIGYAFFETSHIRPSNWQYNLNLMDEVWVSSNANKAALERSGVTKPISVVPIPFIKTPVNKAHDFGIKGRYCFYHIGDWSTRKNTLNLIKSYLCAFNQYDHVVLVLKCYVEGLSHNQSKQFIINEIRQLKSGLKRQQFPPIILLTDYLSPEAISSLHDQADCFVSMERGAAWNLPAFYAVCHNKCCIVPNTDGPWNYMSPLNDGQYLVSVREENVDGMVRCPYASLYTGHETWEDPSPLEMSRYMRFVYDHRPQPNNLELVERYSPEAAGLIFKEIIDVE